MPATIVAKDYNVELRNKDGELKKYLTPFVSKVSWEWNRLGGCGRCSITVKKGYRDIIFDARDDIQIRSKDGATSKLVYRGFIASVTPTLQDDQTVVLDVRGYFDLLKKIVVQDTGDTKTYTSTEVGAMVTDIVDTFVTGNSPITKGTVEAGSFTPDTIDFLSTVDEALRTLSDLVGNVEYGVDETLTFFWVLESSTINHKFFVGDNISILERKVNWDDLVNRIYFVGGEVLGVKYKETGENTDSQAEYFLSEIILNNSSITTSQVAGQYMGAILTEKSNPKFSIRAQVENTPTRLEDTVPMGLVVFYDAEYDRDSPGDLIGDIIGEAADGGSDITVGLTGDGGSGSTIGGQYSGQINRVKYSLSDTPGRFNIEIELGDTVLETSAKIRRLELGLNSLQQL